jgi:NADPH-dependent 2,4-dienoyl-CoA reductase/sulfur reductase-like enzyme/rhodanese-related sulfurtransferase
LVIVGGVAAGASAAAKARRVSEDIEIVVLEAGPYISFANCALPYYVGGEVSQRGSLFVTTASQFSQRYNVDVRVSTEVERVDIQRRRIIARGPTNEQHEIEYDRLILATGTVPARPPVPGLDCGNIFAVRTVPDVDAIDSTVERVFASGKTPETLVIGGGYIGLEAAEQCLRRGLKVTVLEMSTQLMPTLDHEIALQLQRALESAGAMVLLGDGLARIDSSGGGSQAVTSSGKEIPFDLGVLATGVRPNVRLARDAGIRLGDTGAIAADTAQRTSDPAVFAAGDNCESHHLILDEPVNIPLAGPANKAGRVAGANAALDLLNAGAKDGRRLSFRGVLGTSVVRVCGKTAAATGLTERKAEEKGIRHCVGYLPGRNHAGFYPGSQDLLLKLIYRREDGRLLGAQCVGGVGVDKRIDVLATALTSEMTVEDLEQLDLCYAPPFGSAKDPVNLAGFAGANQQRGVMPGLTPSNLISELKNGSNTLLIDVRTAKEFNEDHLPGAINIPLHELRDRSAEISLESPIVVCCKSGHRSYIAQRILLNQGRKNVRNLLGGVGLVRQVEPAFLTK